MAKDRLKRRIAEALAGPAPRDTLWRILSRDDEAEPTDLADATSLHSLLENVKDPILTLDADGPSSPPTRPRAECSSRAPPSSRAGASPS